MNEAIIICVTEAIIICVTANLSLATLAQERR